MAVVLSTTPAATGYWHEPISGGHALFRGPVKLAVVSTSHHCGLYRNGIGISEGKARKDWSVHFTSPLMLADDVIAVAEYVATLPLFQGE